tara:strand:+ start:549 stop:1847 length:1299 start_codon:yes stop_codon:yes gene_type:complete
MKNSILQKLMVGAGVIIMLVAFAVVPEEYPWYYELILFNIGMFMWLFSKRKSFNKVTKSIFTLRSWALCGLLALSIQALGQDYSKQVAALKQSFENKDITYVKPHISAELKFDPMPAANTSAILNNIVANLPFKSLKIIDSENGKAKVFYSFDMMGDSESFIHFDESGKITRIELVENLIKQEMEQARKMRESIQQPNPGEMAAKYPSKKVVFESSDGLQVTGNLFEVDKSAPVILLCHQAGYNKYEYADIAPKLNAMGFNCLAIDQRSGGTFAEQTNETFERANKQQLKTDYVEAEKDMDAAIDYLSKKYGKKVIVWGSSYSSSLALHLASKNKKVSSVIAFSPGDYFGESKVSLKEVLPKLDKPFFITSSKEEAAMLQGLIKDVELSTKKIHFVPESDGFHGSRALWNGQKGADEYWSSLKVFLAQLDNK